MKLTNDNAWGNGVLTFICPYCDFDYMHHMEVEVFARGEDNKKGIHTIIKGFDNNIYEIPTIPNFDENGCLLDDEWDLNNNCSFKENIDDSLKITTDDDVSKCPGRRSAIKIKFYCENCDKITTMTIMQHKGQTFITLKDMKENW